MRSDFFFFHKGSWVQSPLDFTSLFPTWNSIIFAIYVFLALLLTYNKQKKSWETMLVFRLNSERCALSFLINPIARKILFQFTRIHYSNHLNFLFLKCFYHLPSNAELLVALVKLSLKKLNCVDVIYSQFHRVFYDSANAYLNETIVAHFC